MKKLLFLLPILLSGCISLDGYLPGTNFSPVDGSKSLINKVITNLFKRDEVEQEIEVPAESVEVVAESMLQDEIPLNEVVWLGTDISKWPITYNLDIDFQGGHIVYRTEATKKWPKKWMGPIAKGGQLVGNPWVFIKKDGKWYGATYEWLRPGQKSKPLKTIAGDHIKRFSHFSSEWKPTAETYYGFMLSGLVRDSSRNVEERTPIVLGMWP